MNEMPLLTRAWWGLCTIVGIWYLIPGHSPIELRLATTANASTPTITLATVPTGKPAQDVEPTPDERQKEQTRKQYLDRYARIAQVEQQKFGIPASVTLAQAIHESDAGNSKLARRTNNHFGLKCFSKKCKRGHCENFNDDTHKDFFKKFEGVWESYRAHSEFLKLPRYKACFECGQNFDCWARELQRAGYATSKTYSQNLQRLNQLFNLTQYD